MVANDGGSDIDHFLSVLVHDLDGLLTKGWVLLLSICKWIPYTSCLSCNAAKPHTWLGRDSFKQSCDFYWLYLIGVFLVHIYGRCRSPLRCMGGIVKL